MSKKTTMSHNNCNDPATKFTPASVSNSRLIDGLNAEAKKNLKFMFGLILASADAAAEELGTSRNIVLKGLMQYIKDTGI